VRLLDSDVVIDVLRGYLPAIRWLQSLPADEELGLPGFAMFELMEGCENKQAMQRLQRHVRHYRVYWPTEHDLNRVLGTLPQVWLSHRVDILDVLIAERAIGIGVPLCTFNVRHFRAIPGLVTEQPYQRI
jgi:predicted nucleic acid-binding protein